MMDGTPNHLYPELLTCIENFKFARTSHAVHDYSSKGLHFQSFHTHTHTHTPRIQRLHREILSHRRILFLLYPDDVAYAVTVLPRSWEA